MLFSRTKRPGWLPALKKIPIFEDLSAGELRGIADLVYERRYDADEIVFDQGEEGLGLYIVISGSVAIIKVEAQGSLVLATLGPGQFFGEMALLDGAPRSARAKALEPTELIGFFRPELLHLLDTNQSIAAKVSYRLACHVAGRLRQTLEKLSGDTSM